MRHLICMKMRNVFVRSENIITLQSSTTVSNLKGSFGCKQTYRILDVNSLYKNIFSLEGDA